MAPRQITRASPPKVLPTPFSIEDNNADGCRPKKSPARIATISNDKKGLTFFAVKKTWKTMRKNNINRGIHVSCGYSSPTL